VAKFRFRLQAVLDHREMVEQQKQKAVAELEGHRVRLEERIRECQRSIAAEKAGQRSMLGSADILGARRQASAALRLMVAAQRTAIELAGVHKRLEAARAELLEAAKRRKAVELLRERRLDEWKQDMDRREAAALDELSVMRAARKGDEP
jgi:flagellar FliJ protein